MIQMGRMDLVYTLNSVEVATFEKEQTMSLEEFVMRTPESE